MTASGQMTKYEHKCQLFDISVNPSPLKSADRRKSPTKLPTQLFKEKPASPPKAREDADPIQPIDNTTETLLKAF